MTARFKKLPDDSWGVLVDGLQNGATIDPASLVGTEVQVRRRDGVMRPATLLTLVEVLDNGAAAIYTAESKGGWAGGSRRRNGVTRAASRTPAPKTVQVTEADLHRLLDNGSIVVDGVTITFVGAAA